jgi:hypothetical protein
VGRVRSKTCLCALPHGHPIDLRGAIHHDGSPQARRPTALSAPWSAVRQALTILVVLGAAATAAAFLFVGSVSFPSLGPSLADLAGFALTATTLAFLALYGVLMLYEGLKSLRAAVLNVEVSEALISSDSIERIVSEFSQHIDESSIRCLD